MADYLIYNTLTDKVRPDSFHADYHIHLLCRGGRMDFLLGNRPQTVQAGDLLIWQMTTDFAELSYSEDFNADILMISNPFLVVYNPEQVWATKGYMYIKANPVFHLQSDEWEMMETDFLQFYQRTGSNRALFKDEKIGLLFATLLYDLWDIYSREMEKAETEDIVSRRFFQFLLAVQQNCRKEREVAFYSNLLNISPKYLSEICHSVTGKPASHWIEYYTAHELVKLLSDPRVSLTDIVDRMHFSSQPMLTRYLKRTVGKTPSEYRKSLNNDSAKTEV